MCDKYNAMFFQKLFIILFFSKIFPRGGLFILFYFILYTVYLHLGGDGGVELVFRTWRGLMMSEVTSKKLASYNTDSC